MRPISSASFLVAVLFTTTSCGEVVGLADAGSSDGSAVDARAVDARPVDASPDAMPVARNRVFLYTGAAQTFVVPAGVSRLDVVAFGAKGGCISGGRGGEARATIPVTPGETLMIQVGGEGQCGVLGMLPGGFNGGGDKYTTSGDVWLGGSGGGASDVRRAAGLDTRVIVAGGGGASGYDNGGAGGAGGGQLGLAGDPNGGGCGAMPCQGLGGSQVGGGAGGFCQSTCIGLNGALGQGGRGTGCAASGGGGGGGFYGGGGGAHCAAGGGSSKADFAGNTSPITVQGVRSGHGEISLAWLE